MTGLLFTGPTAGRRPTEQIEAARFLASRGRCSTPMDTLCLALDWSRDKAKRILTLLYQAKRVQGFEIDALELTSGGRAWLAMQEVSRG